MKELRCSWPGAIIIGVVSMLMTGGCRYVEELLEEQAHEVDPRQVFPSFVSVSKVSAAPDDGTAADSDPWSFSPCDGWGGIGSRRLRLGGLFTAELPPEEGWALAESSRATILARYRSGSSLPSAYLYAERMDEKGLGASLRLFLQRIDGRLDLPDLPSLGPIGAPENVSASRVKGVTADGTSGVPPEDSPQIAGDASSLATAPGEDELAEPQAGSDPPGAALSEGDAGADASSGQLTAERLGRDGVPASFRQIEPSTTEGFATLQPGYTSEEGSFSGWKWMGSCAPPRASSKAAAGIDSTPIGGGLPGGTRSGEAVRPFLRFGRSQGEWRLQAGTESIPAYQILATVTLPDHRNYGVYLAIVCTAVPQCEDAPTLARILGSIRVASSTGGPSGDNWGGETLRELAAEVGILAPASQNQ